ncbi:dUTP diphosphatase [Alicyclobacillus fastidiosus]|uniref:Deoxyuridine 5'-triphosphate nucleotidohydrolase n=1 Tax=Alicyclobacillus fastidiosus TaxID=392011 RepID=A0ABY6ZBD8_9BACL|nr:dUTP diphosphatase [Alicyclobacillus fastidiosus]WAH40164.1 dUTP diphosphatase [Alicyclobacillus fastidiosus]GMA61509.1 deoxyuridine 5'-triphosphate nucleotidohydrolase [Alicyclobacillus fastidiosus]
MSGSEIQVSFRVVSDLFEPNYMPAYASEGAAGMDLHAVLAESLAVSPGARVRVPTGIAIQLPRRDLVALVYARSGLAWRSGLALSNGVGVVDSDYTGELQVLLTNFGEEMVVIAPGDRIAQLVIAPIHVVAWVRATELAETARGDGGFGSTGIKG